MYTFRLGEFLIPTAEDWIPGITYRAEPPIVSPGALNPWQQERQRQLWLAEEAAWKILQGLQARYVAKEAELKQIIANIQEAIRRIEALTGKKSGLADAANYAVLVYSLAQGPYGWAVSLFKMGFDYFTSMSKKHQLGNLVDYYRGQAARYTIVKAEVDSLVHQVEQQLAVSQQVKISQAIQQQQVLEQSKTAYEVRQGSAQMAALAEAERNRMMALQHPVTRHGGSDAL